MYKTKTIYLQLVKKKIIEVAWSCSVEHEIYGY